MSPTVDILSRWVLRYLSPQREPSHRRHPRQFAGSLIGALLLLTAFHAGAQDERTLLDKADTLRVHDACKEARKIYDRKFNDPELAASALVGRALCRSRMKEPLEDVVADLHAALQLRPDHFRAYSVRADLYHAMRMNDRALEDLDTALRFARDRKDSLSALEDRASLYYEVRRNQDAVNDLQLVLTLDSTNNACLNDMAMNLDAMGRTEEAFAYLERFIARDPEHQAGYMNMAYFLSAHDRCAEAVIWFDKAEAKGDEHPYLYNNRGYCKMRSGDLKGALKDIERSIALDERNSYAYRNLGLLMKEQGQKDKACTAFEKALALGFTTTFGTEVQDLRRSYCR